MVMLCRAQRRPRVDSRDVLVGAAENSGGRLGTETQAMKLSRDSGMWLVSKVVSVECGTYLRRQHLEGRRGEVYSCLARAR